MSEKTVHARSKARPQPWWAFVIEGVLIGGFMLAACGFGVLLYHPDSPPVRALPNQLPRDAMMGLAMALTAVVLTYSPIGKRTGPHMNPAVTLCFYRLGAMRRIDAVGYVLAQCIGAVLGTLAAALLLGSWLAGVNYVVTQPGSWGVPAAWGAEFVIAFIFMSMVLSLNRVPRLAPWTGIFAAGLVFLYITFESHVSGMSLNPARSLGSAVVGTVWHALWIYFTAPTLGMLAGLELQRCLVARHRHVCGKLTHSRRVRCLFHCNCLGSDGSRSDTM